MHEWPFQKWKILKIPIKYMIKIRSISSQYMGNRHIIATFAYFSTLHCSEKYEYKLNFKKLTIYRRDLNFL